jgi:hypothetical protein
MRLSLITVVIQAVALLPAPLAGQGLIPGDRIRVREAAAGTQPNDGQWTDASVVRLVGDTLWYESVTDSSATLLMSQSEVIAGRNYGRTAATVLGLIGAGVGAGVAYFTFEPRFETKLSEPFICLFGSCSPQPVERQVNSRETRTRVGALLGGGSGVLIGWLVGRSVWSWTPVEVTQFATSADGFTIGFSFRRQR